MNQGTALVEVTDLNFAYRHGEGWLRVLHGVSFTIRRGEVFGLVGESGCGKSTLAYQLLGYRREFTRIESGRISFAGLELHKLARSALDKLRGNRISLVPQNPTTALSPAMRIGRQLMEVLEFHGASNGAGRRNEPQNFCKWSDCLSLNPSCIGIRTNSRAASNSVSVLRWPWPASLIWSCSTSPPPGSTLQPSTKSSNCSPNFGASRHVDAVCHS